MKKLLFVIVAAIAFVACEKEPFVQANDFTERELSNKVSLNQALVYAKNSINGIGTSTRSTSRKVKSTEIFVAKPSTRSVESEEVSFYLINYENNEGYAMVSTDSRTTPVYAYSDEGNLNPEDFENNPGLKIFLEGAILNYEDEIANCSTYGIGDRLPIELPDSSYGDIAKMPIVEYDGGYYYQGYSSETIEKEELLTTYWHQGSPYGDYCLNDVGGCGPVAAAQIMAYHKHPSIFGSHLYNWNAMTATPTLSSGSIGASFAAQLILDIGIEAEADYILEENPEDNRTSTEIPKIKDMFRAFDYNCTNPTSYDINRVKENINAERPVYIRGDNNDEGHAWVIDGYQYNATRVTYYYTYEPYGMYDSNIIHSSTYFHCNLGWGNSAYDQTNNNGYFYAYSFIYNNDLKVIYDIMPN